MEKKTFVIAFIALSLFFPGCAGEEGAEKHTVSGGAEKAIKNFVLTETEKDSRKWTLKAEAAKFKEDGGASVVELDNFSVNFYQSGKEKTCMEGRKGFYNRKTQVIETAGRVIVENNERKIITEDIRWDPERELFITEAEVTIETKDGLIKGKGLEASKDLKQLRLKEKISGKLKN